MANAWLCLVNYPLTILVQSVSKSEEMFFIMELLILYLLKILIQFVSAKVRADIEHPLFTSNHSTIKELKEKIIKKGDSDGDETLAEGDSD